MSMEDIGNLTMWQVRMLTCAEEECSGKVKGETDGEIRAGLKRYKDDFDELIEDEVERQLSWRRN